jgi:hypothetical protein
MSSEIRRWTVTSRRSSAASSPACFCSHRRPCSSRAGKATARPRTVRPTSPVPVGTWSSGGSASQANVPLTPCRPVERRTAGPPGCAATIAGRPSTRTSCGQARASPGRGTHSSRSSSHCCVKRPPRSERSSPSRAGQAHWRLSASPWKNGQRSCSWPYSTQSTHGRSGSGVLSLVKGSADAATDASNTVIMMRSARAGRRIMVPPGEESPGRLSPAAGSRQQASRDFRPIGCILPKLAFGRAGPTRAAGDTGHQVCPWRNGSSISCGAVTGLFTPA